MIVSIQLDGSPLVVQGDLASYIILIDYATCILDLSFLIQRSMASSTQKVSTSTRVSFKPGSLTKEQVLAEILQPAYHRTIS